jgi:hypothetical protein
LTADARRRSATGQRGPFAHQQSRRLSNATCLRKPLHQANATSSRSDTALAEAKQTNLRRRPGNFANAARDGMLRFLICIQCLRPRVVARVCTPYVVAVGGVCDGSNTGVGAISNSKGEGILRAI